MQDILHGIYRFAELAGRASGVWLHKEISLYKEVFCAVSVRHIVNYIDILPAQVAQCQDHLGHKSIGTGCSNQMQVAQGQVLH